MGGLEDGRGLLGLVPGPDVLPRGFGLREKVGLAGRAEEAFDLANNEMANWPDSPDFFFVLGHLAFERAPVDPANAATNWLPLAAAAWERCLEIGERPDLESSMQGCGSHLARNNLTVVRGQLAQLGAAA